MNLINDILIFIYRTVSAVVSICIVFPLYVIHTTVFFIFALINSICYRQFMDEIPIQLDNIDENNPEQKEQLVELHNRINKNALSRLLYIIIYCFVDYWKRLKISLTLRV